MSLLDNLVAHGPVKAGTFVRYKIVAAICPKCRHRQNMVVPYDRSEPPVCIECGGEPIDELTSHPDHVDDDGPEFIR